MTIPRKPIAAFETHEVINQPPPFADVDLFATDHALVVAVARAGDSQHVGRLSEFGRKAGAAEVIDWGVQANRHPPELVSFDHYGQRLDEVRFHPAYHHLMALGLDNGVAAVAWDGTPSGHVLHAALSFVLGQADAGPICPMTMTYAAVPALRMEPELGAFWEPRVLAARYDERFVPAADKAGVTLGMAMTEKQGGSDVRANTSRAEPADGGFVLTGHKWFCSAPMSDAFLTLAHTDKGLTCFLVPRWLPDGTRNAGFRIVRLKDKLGDRSNASAEIEYHRAFARRVGEEGRGVQTIIRMVQHTRLDCVIGSASTMRAALVQALWHTAHRSAFGKTLQEHPAMAAVLADLAVESEAATALAFFLAGAFDRDEPLTRLLTPVAKYWVCKRLPAFVYEAMECLGGAGYVETGPMPRLFRQSPLNAIWEGSGNVVALDVLRAMEREPEARADLDALLDRARGRFAAYDNALARLRAMRPGEAQARHFVEALALAAEAAVLICWDSPAAEAFVRLRFEHPSAMFGGSDAKIPVSALIERAMPHNRSSAG